MRAKACQSAWAVLVLLGLGFTGVAAQDRSDNPADDPKLVKDCHLIAIEDVDVPAPEPGVLMKINVKEGDSVQEDAVLAQIDDREAVMARKVASHEYNAAKKQAENKISVEAARKSYEVAVAELETAKEANAREKGSISLTEVRRLGLNCDKFRLQTDLAEYENEIAAATALGKFATFEQAGMMIERRKLKAPHSGVVIKLYRHKGNWVSPGDPVLRVVRLDTLRVVGSVSAINHHWNEVKGRPVEVTVTLPGGQKVKVSSTVGFAAPEFNDDKTFRVWADVPNEQVGDGWQMGPGLEASMRLQ